MQWYLARTALSSNNRIGRAPPPPPVTVVLADMQEMQNHVRATIDRGLRELHSNQGKGGLPALPPAATKPPVPTEFAAIAPPPDPNGETETGQQAPRQ